MSSTESYGNLQLEAPEFFNYARDVLDKLAENSDKLALWWVDDTGNEIKKNFCSIVQRFSQSL